MEQKRGEALSFILQHLHHHFFHENCLKMFEVFDPSHLAHGIDHIMVNSPPRAKESSQLHGGRVFFQPQGQQVRNPLKNGTLKIMSTVLHVYGIHRKIICGTLEMALRIKLGLDAPVEIIMFQCFQSITLLFGLGVENKDRNCIGHTSCRQFGGIHQRKRHI